MKILVNDESNIIIFLNNLIFKKLDLTDKEELEDYFRELFLNLKTNYNIKISGYYIIDVYIDDIYGAIIELIKEDLEYFEYFDNQVDMRIIINEEISFLFEIDDIFDINKQLLDKFNIYKYRNKIYLKNIVSVSYLDIGRLIEHANIIYKEEVDQILKHGILIKI